jgi:hypothetical protein
MIPERAGMIITGGKTSAAIATFRDSLINLTSTETTFEIRKDLRGIRRVPAQQVQNMGVSIKITSNSKTVTLIARTTTIKATEEVRFRIKTQERSYAHNLKL